MVHRLHLATGIGVLVLLLPVGARAQSCADPTAAVAERLLARARQFASDSSYPYALFRDSILTIARIPNDSVVLVTDETTCYQAKSAYQSITTSNSSQHRVRV